MTQGKCLTDYQWAILSLADDPARPLKHSAGGWAPDPYGYTGTERRSAERLVARGLLTRTGEGTTAGQRRKAAGFALTDAGRAALKSGRVAAPDPSPEAAPR